MTAIATAASEVNAVDPEGLDPATVTGTIVADLAAAETLVPEAAAAGLTPVPTASTRAATSERIVSTPRPRQIRASGG